MTVLELIALDKELAEVLIAAQSLRVFIKMTPYPTLGSNDFTELTLLANNLDTKMRIWETKNKLYDDPKRTK
jgi:hypothetical protein